MLKGCWCSQEKNIFKNRFFFALQWGLVVYNKYLNTNILRNSVYLQLLFARRWIMLNLWIQKRYELASPDNPGRKRSPGDHNEMIPRCARSSVLSKFGLIIEKYKFIFSNWVGLYVKLVYCSEFLFYISLILLIFLTTVINNKYFPSNRKYFKTWCLARLFV